MSSGAFFEPYDTYIAACKMNWSGPAIWSVIFQVLHFSGPGFSVASKDLLMVAINVILDA